MKIFISAAEASSDVHASRLVQSLFELCPQVDLFGVGGPCMKAAGFRQVVDYRELLVMGLVEVFRSLPRILRILGQVTQLIREEKPDLIVFLDYPSFHLRLAKRVFGIAPLIYYIPPKLWIWKKNRIHFLKKYFKRVLCIFPFEKKFYEDLGLSVIDVGNPTLEGLPFELSKTKAREALKLSLFSPEEKLCVWMPGSRPAEIKEHLDFSLEVLNALQKKSPFPLRVLFPVAKTLQFSVIENQIQAWKQKNKSSLRIDCFPGSQAALCLLAADVGLIKSGTSTLEAGLLGCPHILFYRAHWFTEWVFRYVIGYRGWIGLVNWVMGKEVIPERIGKGATLASLVQDLLGLLRDDAGKRTQMIQDLAKLRLLFNTGSKKPSQLAAQAILDEVLQVRRP